MANHSPYSSIEFEPLFKLVLSPLQSENEARVFAWSCMSGQEVFVGEITNTADRSRTITNNKVVTGHGQSGCVEGIALTRFHVLTLHSNAIAATCLLNNQLVFLDEFDKRDPVCGLIQSPTEASPWVFSLRSVFTYRVKSEGRSVWRIYLELGDFEGQASKFLVCDTSFELTNHNTRQYNCVTVVIR